MTAVGNGVLGYVDYGTWNWVGLSIGFRCCEFRSQVQRVELRA
jgi:hypothetical protein